MNVILNPLGSHGDVHPFLALGQGLKARGHHIHLVSSAPFVELAEQLGFTAHPIGTHDDYEHFAHNADLWNPSRSFQVMFGGELFERMLRQTYFKLAELSQQAGSVVVSGTLSLAARLLHEKQGTPLVTVHLQPLALFSLVEPPELATVKFRRWWPLWFRRLAKWIGSRWMLDPLLKPPVNRLRAELGLRPIANIFGDWRHSPQCVLGLFPAWYASAPDWPPQTRLTGFLRYDQADRRATPAVVVDFLRSGPPPVIFSFGTAMRTGRAYFEAAAKACLQAGWRGLILAKGGDQIPTDLPPTVLHTDYAPFSEVFPQAACVVHHGGIGTTAQALAAGIPQLIMPMAFDQPDNARILRNLGVARTLIPSKFTAVAVAEELRQLLQSSHYGEKAKALAQRLSGQDAVAESCEVIESLHP